MFIPVVDQDQQPLMPTTPRHGYETAAYREALGLSQYSDKLAERWDAHCVDAWVLAHSNVGGSPPAEASGIRRVAVRKEHFL